MKIEQTAWGRSIEILKGPKQEEGRTIESAGVNFIEPGQIIPLHVHTENTEDYIPQTEGLRILVVNKEEAMKMSEEEAVHAVKVMLSSKVNDVITCHSGYAHALFNSATTQGAFVFIKYN